MSKTPLSERKHIVIIGKRNAGKSSIANRILGQDLSIVSSTPGTTTDPVKKAMELLPYGPVVLVDTAGIDDIGELGSKRISKTIKAISEADFAIVVLDANSKLNDKEIEMFGLLNKFDIPFIVALNKTDIGISEELISQLKDSGYNYLKVSGFTGEGIFELKEKLVRLMPKESEPPLIGDLIKQHDIVVLVVPIDLGAPKGRLIMPQVQTIREALDEDAIVVVSKDKELRSTLDSLNKKPKLVVTDSQAVMRVNADVPEDIAITTFSIIMARYKGDLPEFIRGLRQVEDLENGDKVLIAEACTHHAQEDDIGKVKIPRWLRLHTKKDIIVDVRNGADYPDDLHSYKLIVHCGGCMLTRRAMQTRIKQARILNIPIVNYGVLISYMHGALPRAIEPFEEALSEWQNLFNSL